MALVLFMRLERNCASEEYSVHDTPWVHSISSEQGYAWWGETDTLSAQLRNTRLCAQSTLSLSLEASTADRSIFKSRRPENSSWKLGSGVSLSHPKQAKHVKCETHLNTHIYKYTHSVWLQKQLHKSAQIILRTYLGFTPFDLVGLYLGM